MHICKYCNKEFEKYQSLSAHIRHCRLNPNFDEKRYRDILSKGAIKGHNTYLEQNKHKYEKHKYTFKCIKCGKEYNLLLTESQYNKHQYTKFCSKSCANTRCLSQETKDKISQSIKTKINNGEKVGFVNLKREHALNAKLHTCIYCGKEFWSWKRKSVKYEGKYCSEQCHQDYINNVYKKKLGGYRKGSGRGKSGWYKGIYCDSSWELAFVIYHIDNNLSIRRCKEHRKYIFEDKEHIYIPDFVTDEGIIEIKGYSTPQWKAKEEQNKDVKVLYKDDIQFYLNYVNLKYGNDFIKLYDDSKPIQDITKNVNIWVHKLDEDNKIFYTKIINPNDYEYHINDGWIKGRSVKPEGFIKEHVKTRNIFKR